MLLIQQLTLFALASTIVALPHRFRKQKQTNNGLEPGCVRQGRNIVVCTVTVTASRTVPTSSRAPVNTPAPLPSVAPSPSPLPSSSPAPQPAPQPAPKPSSTAPTGAVASGNGNNPAPAPAPAPGVSGGQGNYMAVVSEMRNLLGLGPLVQDTLLESNIMRTLIKGNGVMNHTLFPGTFRQVLAQSKDFREDDFRRPFVHSWLCEIRTLPGVSALCDPQDGQGSEIGHAKILADIETKSTKIGCAFLPTNAKDGNLWGCDLA